MTGDRGAALIIVLLTMTLIASIGAALALTTAVETMVTGDFERLHEARYAAEGAFERALVDIAAIGDWNLLVSGGLQSTFTDGPPLGARTLADGASLDLAHVVNVANCGKAAACSAADVTGNATGLRPWGPNNPVWHLFAYGRFDTVLPGAVFRSKCYVVVLVADDPAEIDGEPSVDGATPCDAGQRPPACNPGSGAIAVRAEAFGPRGAHQIVESIVARPRAPGLPLRTRAEWASGVR